MGASSDEKVEMDGGAPLARVRAMHRMPPDSLRPSPGFELVVAWESRAEQLRVSTVR